MNLHTTVFFAILVSSALITPFQRSTAQGTVKSVTFDGPPFIQPTDSIAVTYYTERGMVFTPVGPNLKNS